MTSWAMVVRLCARGVVLNNTRQYASKVSRRPIRVLTKEGCIDYREQKPLQAETTTPSVETKEEEDGSTILEGKPSRLPPGFPVYTKMGPDDSSLSRFAMDTTCSLKREKSDLIMLEGKRLIKEALQARLLPKAIFFSRVQDVISLPLPPTNFIFQKVNYTKLQRWSKVSTTQGVLGFFPKPSTNIKKSHASLPFSIICDNVRDPGNLGSILRVAASAGCKRVLLTEGCVDLWSDKVLRSAMGCHFHINIEENVKWNDIERLIEPDTYVIFADNKDLSYSSSTKVIQDDVLDESYLRNIDEANTSQAGEISEENADVADKWFIPEERNNSDETSELMSQLPVYPYYQVDYSQMKNIVLVIGGETKGLSENALQFGKSSKGVRVNIPMLNNVESLNVSAALAVITHEIKRQFYVGRSNELEEPLNTDPSPVV